MTAREGRFVLVGHAMSNGVGRGLDQHEDHVGVELVDLRVDAARHVSTVGIHARLAVAVIEWSVHCVAVVKVHEEQVRIDLIALCELVEYLVPLEVLEKVWIEGEHLLLGQFLVVLVTLRVDDVGQHEVVVEGEARRRAELLSRQAAPPLVDLYAEGVLARVFAADHEESHGCLFLSLKTCRFSGVPPSLYLSPAGGETGRRVTT